MRKLSVVMAALFLLASAPAFAQGTEPAPAAPSGGAAATGGTTTTESTTTTKKTAKKKAKKHHKKSMGAPDGGM